MKDSAFAFKNSHQYETQSKLISKNAPLPKLETKRRDIILAGKQDLAKTQFPKQLYKKRTSSRKEKEEKLYEAQVSVYPQTFTEMKHLLNNCPPNYIELNKMVIERAKNAAKGAADFDTRHNDLNKLTRTTKYKYGLKGVLVSFGDAITAINNYVSNPFNYSQNPHLQLHLGRKM